MTTAIIPIIPFYILRELHLLIMADNAWVNLKHIYVDLTDLLFWKNLLDKTVTHQLIQFVCSNGAVWESSISRGFYALA